MLSAITKKPACTLLLALCAVVCGWNATKSVPVAATDNGTSIRSAEPSFAEGAASHFDQLNPAARRGTFARLRPLFSLSARRLRPLPFRGAPWKLNHSDWSKAAGFQIPAERLLHFCSPKSLKKQSPGRLTGRCVLVRGIGICADTRSSKNVARRRPARLPLPSCHQKEKLRAKT